VIEYILMKFFLLITVTKVRIEICNSLVFILWLH